MVGSEAMEEQEEEVRLKVRLMETWTGEPGGVLVVMMHCWEQVEGRKGPWAEAWQPSTADPFRQ